MTILGDTAQSVVARVRCIPQSELKDIRRVLCRKRDQERGPTVPSVICVFIMNDDTNSTKLFTTLIMEYSVCTRLDFPEFNISSQETPLNQ